MNEPPPAKTQEKIAEYRQIDQELATARQSALQNPDVEQARAAFAQAPVSEMEQVEPDTQKLIIEQQRLSQQLAMLMQGSGQAAPPAGP